MLPDLPVAAVLADIRRSLRDVVNLVIVAPPGAGKTTAVAPALTGEDWVAGRRILLLSPRRLAARAAAERMAEQAGEPVGRSIGYRTRMDSRVSAATRIEVVTEGIFTRLIQDDPELADIAAVLFDEVHERSLEGDLGLALALDAQAAIRPDLRIVAMSATLDGARYAALLGNAPVIEAQGRMFPVTERYVGRDPRERIEDEVARAARRALGEEEGSLLVFLPGAAEIERVYERLGDLPGIAVHRLYGALDAADQRAAIQPASAGQRKIVLATSIAETSLTIDGVRVVIDSGLARRPRYERGTGLVRLVTERASQAAATQRAGRAGRTAPGTVWRLWEAAQTGGLPPFDPPEILESDLSGLVLDLAVWGVSNPATLRWLDPPPPAAVAEARDRLRLVGALDDDGRPTAHGRLLSKLPVPPRLAHMLVSAAAHGWGIVAGEAAVLVSERGLGGNDPDADLRLRRWRQARDRRSDVARGLAGRWAKLVRGKTAADVPDDILGQIFALAWPDRVARRRTGSDGLYLMRNGRAVKLDPGSALATAEWLAVAEASGGADGARVLLAAAIDAASVDALFADAIEHRTEIRFDPATAAVIAEDRRSLGAITLRRQPAQSIPAERISACLTDGITTLGLACLPWSDATLALRARTAFARAHGADLPDLSDDALLAALHDWLPPALDGIRKVSGIDPAALHQALEARLDWPQRQALDRLAPPRFATPAGTSHAIDYAAEGGPAVSLRVQELFGLGEHPAIAGGKVPLGLVLLSPAHRPIQTTRDLPGFWRGSWRAVQADMKGRYPRHPWPDDPAAASATTRTKRADARAGGAGT